MFKKLLKAILLFFLALVLIVVGYVAYLFLSYHRIDDNTKTDIASIGSPEPQIKAGQEYRIASSNVGFGAYSDDYSFFMDGGTESWAFSKEAVNDNINGSIDVLSDINPDLMILQEVDIDATRSYHVNEKDLILDGLSKKGFNNISNTFALNYDSGFLFYPFNQPHGKTKAGLLTVSDFEIKEATRRSLPIEEGISKFIDLDRCYNKSIIDMDNGKKLVLYNVHLSAYTTNPETSNNQVKLLNEDMAKEAAAGNYVIAGGDMNKDVLIDSAAYFHTTGTENWAKPFPEDYLSAGLKLVKPVDEANPIPSCRNADKPYADDSFVITIDGFIVSDNVEIKAANVYDNQFKYSDHNPVYMDFVLK
ncbi:MAG: endonuclease/exonuclease/phosphatase family protein [Pseudobutyrivibrio sp.]|nr:endonuclease/exonuclease/phosphatase family protein [Pseudobutyrivibrio sp.]